MLNNHWFTEPCKEGGSAFSLEIKKKCHEEKTRYQTIEIYETTTFGHLMVIDGFIMLSQRDHFFYHEMMTHPALFSHPNPQNVVIIGGGDCGSLQQVLKHPGVEKVHQIDIDERVTRLSERYFPELCENNQDPRAQFSFIDGIEWMKNVQAASIDLIIIDSTDPIGPGEVLFTEQFYQYCHRALRTEGNIILQSESPLYHAQLIESISQRIQRAGFYTPQLFQFPQPVYPSAWWTAMLASKSPSMQFRENDAKEKPFKTEYYTSEMHHAARALPPYLKRSLSF